ncbi:UNVERIFIED_CONTAM: hypothetical protein GTU68_031250, partial [Idotea baltica]|nr:hypothetical protein [Idotea baltica]
QFRGFYKGLGFPCGHGDPESLFFGVYGTTACRYMSKGREKATTVACWAGCAGGVAQLVVSLPDRSSQNQMQNADWWSRVLF